MKASKFVMAAAVGAVAVIAASAQASLVVFDNFNGAAGATLHDHYTDIGNKNWMVSDGGGYSYSNAVFTGTGGVTTQEGAYGSAQGAIYLGGYQPWDYSIVANILVTQNVNYVAIGFANSNLNLDFNNLGQPSVRLNSDGTYQFYGVTGKSGVVFDPTVYNKFELRNIVGNDGVNLYINDQFVTSQWYGGLWDSAHAAQYTSAAFRIDNWTNSGGTVIDYFAVGANPVDVVPEPATLGMLGLVGAGLMIKRRR